MKSFSTASLLASCLATCALAIPVERAQPPSPRGLLGNGNRVVGWDYRNSESLTDGLVSTASTICGLLGGGKVSAVMNWEAWLPSELNLKGPSFQPMVQTPDRLGGQWWQFLLDRIGEGSNVVHFYNEPDMKGVDAGEAARTWQQTMIPLRDQYGIKLVGPSVSSGGGGAPWLQTFMGQLSDDQKPDYLGAHFYTNAGSAVDSEIQNAQGYFSTVHDTYGIPLMITEMGCTSRNGDDVKKFNDAMMSWLDDAPQQAWVAQYSIFGFSREPADDFVSPEAQMLTTNGDLTPLGKDFVGTL